MEPLFTAALAWVLVASVLAFAFALFDKHRAVAGASRVSERTLLGLALLGGSPGLGAAMLIARHKTRKASFFVPYLLIVVLHAALLAWWLLG